MAQEVAQGDEAAAEAAVRRMAVVGAVVEGSRLVLREEELVVAVYVLLMALPGFFFDSKRQRFFPEGTVLSDSSEGEEVKDVEDGANCRARPATHASARTWPALIRHRETAGGADTKSRVNALCSQGLRVRGWTRPSSRVFLERVADLMVFWSLDEVWVRPREPPNVDGQGVLHLAQHAGMTGTPHDNLLAERNPVFPALHDINSVECVLSNRAAAVAVTSRFRLMVTVREPGTFEEKFRTHESLPSSLLPNCLAWGRDASVLSVVGANGHSYVMSDISDDGCVRRVLKEDASVGVFAQSFADNNKVILRGHRNGKMSFVDLRGPKTVLFDQVPRSGTTVHSAGWLRPLEFTDDQSVIVCATNASAGSRSGLLLFDRRFGKGPVSEFPGHITSHRHQNRPCVDPDETLLAAVGHDSSMRVWDLRTGRRLHALPLSSPHGALDLATPVRCSISRAPGIELWASVGPLTTLIS
ncbi:Uncharacterized protein SCF082_LOCUS17147 [Durusdinium trenchii]|uniref:Uncharacterized protein n=1 Tax=Durusdinium trenchii TaxID=1381693 RepID=A0ABP0KG24_9DINO